MESLSDETWDAVIAGTSLPQSLLALALSKCDVKVLHVDKNDYYGGSDAGLSLSEAERWIQMRQESDDVSKFSCTKLSPPSSLGPSRAYTIALNPQIIYAKSRFLPTLVSSQIHSQLEFQAVGSFWVYADGKLQKIPSNREDVFSDDTISIRDKRKLMGLLRYVLEEQDDPMKDETGTLDAKLQTQFKFPRNLLPPVQALTLSTNTISNVRFDTAMTRLKLHLSSMGYFGPGLAAVMAKYGGNAEISQVACRAGAVGGFVYLLGHGLDAINASTKSEPLASVNLSDGTTVKAKYVVGSTLDFPEEMASPLPTDGEGGHHVSHLISIISNPLRHLFSSTSESGPAPAVTIVLVDDNSEDRPPIYLQVHSEDTGECPTGQCIIYASCLEDNPSTRERLTLSVTQVISTAEAEGPAEVMWSISFIMKSAMNQTQTTSLEQDSSGKILILPQRSHDIAFDDTILDSVKAAWEKILGDRCAEYDFLRFEERRDEDEEAD